MRLIPLALVTTLVAGCNMSLSSSGSIGDQGVFLDGTGWAWLDETAYVTEDGALVRTSLEGNAARLQLRFSSAVFDPGVDLRALSAADARNVRDDVARGDLLTLVVRRGDRVAADDTYTWDASEVEVPDTSPWLALVDLQLADPPVTPGDEYPEELVRYGSERRGRVTFRAVSERIVGDAEVTIARAPEDPADAATGTVTVRFDVPLLSERLAECNWDRTGAGAVDPCTLEPFSGGAGGTIIP